MTRAERTRPIVAIALFGWMPLIAIGLVAGHFTHTVWPAPACAVAWLATLAVVLRRYASRSR